MATWKEDRLTLKAMARNNKGTTLIYVMISQMREKLHMKCYNMRTGGWRSNRYVRKRPESAPAAYLKQYGSMAQHYYERSAITDLDDQALWIRLALELLNDKKLNEIGHRILDKSWPVAIPA